MSAFPIRKSDRRHETWPYSKDDFARSDESGDTGFYNQPRYVAHIDDAALARLTAYYETVLPRKGRILDLCTSWKSWYPADCEKAVSEDRTLEVFGIGLNEAEMARNALFQDHPERYATVDLNEGTHVIGEKWPQYKDGSGQESAPVFDSVTCAVSIDYLVEPVAVLQSVRKSVVDGGKIHLIISDRCFPTKAVKIWLRSSAEERLQLVSDYLQFSGWDDIEIVDLCAHSTQTADSKNTPMLGAQLMSFLQSLQHRDPLWVVRATKKG